MITLLDTTLRDGEQTSGVSFAMQEKMAIARLLLEDLHVDRIEIASATVSDGEFETVRNILDGVTTKDNIWNVNTEKEYHEEKKESWNERIFWAP